MAEYRESGFYHHTSTPENIIYGNYVKMDKMWQLTANTFSNTSIAAATELNVFIDLYAVLHAVFSENNHVIIDDPMAITSGIINMCGHYRSFFKRLSVRTYFYLVFSLNICDINRKMVAGYNDKFYQKTQVKMIRNIIDKNLDILDLLCKYLPNIYFVKSNVNFESSVIIADLIEKVGMNRPNLIISKDILPVQLTTLYPYTSYLYPKKNHNGDVSIMLPINEKITFREEFWNLISSIRKYTDPTPLYSISPINIPLLFAMSKFPERNLYAESNVSIFKNVCLELVGNEDIKIDPDQLDNSKVMQEHVKNIELIKQRYKCLDIQFMLPFYQSNAESKMIQFEDLEDSATINQINSIYFEKNPIDLTKL